ncbi:hypothetical protein PanWU01x14_119210 [Parasponia andersonii]|uniref:Uncharacterized protein n=1 Tax=Parasponia andersonii TaxID=3476 RepID=A0A2P5CVY8_PARAD|nr:hypothetical protein PanWU01x14_119210 [Parasponia andersonii]
MERSPNLSFSRFSHVLFPFYPTSPKTEVLYHFQPNRQPFGPNLVALPSPPALVPPETKLSESHCWGKSKTLTLTKIAMKIQMVAGADSGHPKTWDPGLSTCFDASFHIIGFCPSI